MVPEIIIVVPPLLGLKGNLEMTLAARYNTHTLLSACKTTVTFPLKLPGINTHAQHTCKTTVTSTLKDEHGSEPWSDGREGRRNLDNRRKPGETKKISSKRVSLHGPEAPSPLP